MNQRYQPAKDRANWAVFFLVAHGILTIISIISTIAEINLLQRIDSGQFVPNFEVDANDNRQAIIRLLYIVSYIAAAVAFLMWIYIASKNLALLGVRNQRFSPGWAVGWYFIPIMNLFQPYRVMVEIWKGSYPQIGLDGPDAWGNSPASPLLGSWWAVWLVSSLIGWWAAFRSLFSDEMTITEIIEADIAYIVSDVFSLVSLCLVVILIRRITAGQEEKHALIRLPTSSGVRYCPQCGASRASDAAMFCVACGSQF